MIKKNKVQKLCITTCFLRLQNKIIPKLRLEENDNIWTRCGPTKVILKRLNNSQYMNREFVNQVRNI